MASGYYVRLAAVLVVAAVLGIAIYRPEAGRGLIEGVAAASEPRESLAEKSCPIGAAPLRAAFAPLDDVLSISPLGGVTAPGEPLPAPFIRINTKSAGSVFERRVTQALAPARADIVAIERRVDRNADGAATGVSWTVRFKPCENVSVYYDRLDEIDDSLLARAGGLAAFTELGGPDHLAIETRIRVREGEVLGKADGFDVGLYDLAAAPATLARPERYDANPYQHAEVLGAPPSLLKAIVPDIARARCAIDYLPKDLAPVWSAKLGDVWGMRSAKGDNACRSALADTPGAAQGAWFTDASHNALTNKVSAIALAPDAIDPERLIFALHGRLRSLTPDMVALAPMLEAERKKAAQDFLTFERGAGRINLSFEKARKGEVYCYQNLRANFVGPKINGVLLMQLSEAANGAALMKLEARSDVMSCIDLEEPWSFSGNETTFYR